MLNHQASKDAIELSDKEFDLIRALIYKLAGISLSSAKKPLVMSRLGKRLKHYDYKTYTQYYKFVTGAEGVDEVQAMVDLLTTNETHFFREPKHFDFMQQQILPQRQLAKPFRVWSAACSSGEEPYSIAMLLADKLGDSNWEIFASDLSTHVLKKAQTGLFTHERIPEVPQPYLKKYCLKGTGNHEGSFLIDRKLRERVTFFQHNLTERAANQKLGEFDVIFLRNVMIYFDQETKQQVVARLMPYLRSGGYFFISHSETLNGISETLKAIAPAVYRKP